MAATQAALINLLLFVSFLCRIGALTVVSSSGGGGSPDAPDVLDVEAAPASVLEGAMHGTTHGTSAALLVAPADSVALSAAPEPMAPVALMRKELAAVLPKGEEKAMAAALAKTEEKGTSESDAGLGGVDFDIRQGLNKFRESRDKCPSDRSFLRQKPLFFDCRLEKAAKAMLDDGVGSSRDREYAKKKGGLTWGQSRGVKTVIFYATNAVAAVRRIKQTQSICKVLRKKVGWGDEDGLGRGLIGSQSAWDSQKQKFKIVIMVHYGMYYLNSDKEDIRDLSCLPR